MTGAGAIAGIGFIVSLLIASLAFRGSQLAEAKVGILSAAVCASALGWVVFRLTAMLPEWLRARALLGTADTIIDLAVPVDAERDHVRGPDRAPVTLVEYGDFECPYCGQAEPVVRELLAGYGDLRYVWRHLPLTDVHPHALLAAEGAEAAALQGSFWEMHDQLLDRQDALTAKDLIRYAAELGLDAQRFTRDLRDHAGEAKIAADVDSADLSGVSGTPTFFINGRRHHGAYDISTLSDAVRAARERVLITSRAQPGPCPDQLTSRNAPVWAASDLTTIEPLPRPGSRPLSQAERLREARLIDLHAPGAAGELLRGAEPDAAGCRETASHQARRLTGPGPALSWCPCVGGGGMAAAAAHVHATLALAAATVFAQSSSFRARPSCWRAIWVNAARASVSGSG